VRYLHLRRQFLATEQWSNQAVERVRPKMMTVAAAMMGLMPINVVDRRGRRRHEARGRAHGGWPCHLVPDGVARLSRHLSALEAESASRAPGEGGKAAADLPVVVIHDEILTSFRITVAAKADARGRAAALPESCSFAVPVSAGKAAVAMKALRLALIPVILAVVWAFAGEQVQASYLW